MHFPCSFWYDNNTHISLSSWAPSSPDVSLLSLKELLKLQPFYLIRDGQRVLLGDLTSSSSPFTHSPITCLEPLLISQFSSVAQLCLTLCDPMNHSMPGLPVHHQLSEFTQTRFHQVSDAIQPSHPLSSPSPPAPNPS